MSGGYNPLQEDPSVGKPHIFTLSYPIECRVPGIDLSGGTVTA